MTSDNSFSFPVAETPPDIVIWRYLSFARFLAVLTQQALYFARPEAFGDPFEAAIGPEKHREEWLEGSRRMFREVLEEARAAGSLDANVAIDDETERLLSDWRQLNRVIPMNTYVSCWHEADFESEAMWRLYAKDTTEGIAIRSTCGRLRKAIAGLSGLRIGRVTYRDYEAGPMHPMLRFFNKRLAFQHEREIRAAFLALDEEPSNEPGRLIQVDLATLIEEVVVSPHAPVWVQPVVASVLERFALSVPVRHSSISAESFRY